MSEDNKALIYDNEQLDEFKSLVAELGLKCDNHIDKEKSPIPYMLLDQATIRAFKMLTPKVDKIKEYRFEIPIEVLRNVKLSETEKYFDYIEIWSNTKDPDPFAVGCVYKTEEDRVKQWSWNISYYLIGRWGAEEKELSELIDDAVKIATRKVKDYADSGIAKLASWQSCPDVWARNYIFNNDTEVSSAINNSGSLPF